MTVVEHDSEEPKFIPAQRKLPNMNEFSPGVLGKGNIQLILSWIQSAAGDKDKVIDQISNNVALIKKTPKGQRSVRANNVLIGMSQCGLVEKIGNSIVAKLTPLAEKILNAATPTDAIHEFAKQLLRNCHGLELLD